MRTARINTVGFISSIAVIGVAAASFVVAADTSERGEAQHKSSKIIGFGIATLTDENPFNDSDIETQLVPIPFIQSQRLNVLGNRASYTLNPESALKFSLNSNIRLDGRDASENERFEGMSDRDNAVEIGVGVTYRTPFASMELIGLADVSDSHNGYQAELKLFRNVNIGQGSLQPSITLGYQSDKLVDYYYGVTANESTVARPLYTADADAYTSLGLSYSIMFNRKHVLITDVATRWSGSEVSDSPLVDSNRTIGALVGYIYLFK